MKTTECLKIGEKWFQKQQWQPFPFQIEAWRAHLDGYSGLVNAPTGSGKTYSLIIPIFLAYIRKHGLTTKKKRQSFKHKGLQAIWITPIRALTREIQYAAKRAATDLGLEWDIAIRSGDTTTNERARQKRKPPQILITTPESLHLLLASKAYEQYFSQLDTVVVDEWHELVGSKRGVQMELALSRLKGFLPSLKVWGISATIGNMEEALEVLLGNTYVPEKYKVIRSNIVKKVEIESLLPDEIEKFPWAGHLGITMIEKVLPIIESSKTTLIFTNTRSFCEIWYQKLLDVAPDLAGAIAMHHGSISRELRDWVENALHEGTLKAVVCTSSLDLGVDFRPVETIIQVGSPKGVARFIQRAGRSGHRPGAKSKIYFVPTHSLELLESAALRQAVQEQKLESRIPYIRSFDVLVQYLVTLAVSDGFDPDTIFEEVKGTFSYHSISKEEWSWLLDFVTTGGESLRAYDEYKKVTIEENGQFKVHERRTAMRHRLSIGTIVSDNNLIVKYISGKKIGTIEEWFVSQLMPGDTFWFAGRNLELVRIKGMDVQVRKSNKKKGKVPSWMGSRMPLSSELAHFLRVKFHQLKYHQLDDIELSTLLPLLEVQETLSVVPAEDELLIEYFQTKEGYHLVIFPLEGRFVHQGMGSLIGYRLSQMKPLSFSIAMNDYGFELVSDQEIPIDEALQQNLFAIKNLRTDIDKSINAVEMARRQFRDIAGIAGLVFKGFPGKQKKDKHLQSSSQLFFDVFHEYEPDNLLLLQAYDEVMNFQLEEGRLLKALERIHTQKIILSKPERPTPFAFPIIVDRLNREKLSSESIEDRVRKMKLQFAVE